jgi:hypothetical protein
MIMATENHPLTWQLGSGNWGLGNWGQVYTFDKKWLSCVIDQDMARPLRRAKLEREYSLAEHNNQLLNNYLKLADKSFGTD